MSIITNENYRRMYPVRAEIIEGIYEDCEKCGTKNVALICEANGKRSVMHVTADFAWLAWNVASLALSMPQAVFFVQPA